MVLGSIKQGKLIASGGATILFGPRRVFLRKGH